MHWGNRSTIITLIGKNFIYRRSMPFLFFSRRSSRRKRFTVNLCLDLDRDDVLAVCRWMSLTMFFSFLTCDHMMKKIISDTILLSPRQTHQDGQEHVSSNKLRIILRMFLNLNRSSSLSSIRNECLEKIIVLVTIDQCGIFDRSIHSTSRRPSRSIFCWSFRIVSPTMNQQWTCSLNVIHLIV